MEDSFIAIAIETFCRRVEELVKHVDSLRKETVEYQKGYEALSKICDGWRNDYQDLNKKYIELQLQYNELKADYDRITTMPLQN